ncbi:MAG TPA: VanW family protein [Caulobacteraceae bacterium]|nr:VanW family protein [Caulobacteraceae bacterium]
MAAPDAPAPKHAGVQARAMRLHALPARAWAPPTRLSGLAFAAKAAVLRARRAMLDMVKGPSRLVRGEASGFAVPAGVSVTPLWSDPALAERTQQQGKVQNLRVAARALDGLILPAGAVFSFWRQVGPPIRARGFARGRMLREGCMVSAVGGGLCQLSNALHEAALRAGCRIVERHPHSRIVPGSVAASGRDATVAWNYVDLRFAADRDLRLSVRLDRGQLAVLLSARVEAAAPRVIDVEDQSAGSPGPAARDCGSCDETDCFLHRPADFAAGSEAGPRVFLVDEAWPEFRAYVKDLRQDGDRLGRPLDGAKLGVLRYAWGGEGFERVDEAPAAALRRALVLRLAGRQQGPARRRAELEAVGWLAERLGRRLTPDVASVVVAQSYLPHLWRTGRLGGREVTVLMSRLPMAALHARLDAAAILHPDRASLADFRAPTGLVEAETEALARADGIVTPHAEIAALFPGRSIKLAWDSPPAGPRRTGPVRRIGFPGPTAARKGAFAVREAAIALDLEVVALGRDLEGGDFWRGARILAPSGLEPVDAVVQPALVEDQPRALLAALAAGVPVIASTACGLDPRPGLTLVPPDDANALIAALRSLGAA